MNIADQFRGLPMEDLIGGPLSAVVKANFSMAKSTADFINQVGFEQTLDPNSKALVAGKPRVVDFSFERPGLDGDGNRTIDLVKLSVPMLAIVPIPSLQVDNVDIVFDMEVKSSTKSTDASSKEASLKAGITGGWGPVKVDVQISGSVSSRQENTRSTDTSAKYHVEVKAASRDLPEGLARVLDMMNQAIKPKDVKQFKADNQGKLPTTADGKLDEAKGRPVDNEGREIQPIQGGNAA